MINTIITIWATMSFCYCIKEWAKPYSGTYWYLDILLAPYAVILDAIDEYQKWQNEK